MAVIRDPRAGEAGETYDAASGQFDDPALGFWGRYGRRTVDRIGLAPGARVLDVCCGAGASALHAAHVVGATGSVVGIDLSVCLLALARAKASRAGLTNLELRAGDMTRLALPDRSFDAVVIVFGLFFAPDMLAQIRALARLLRPGGLLAVTTWGPRMFEPLYTPFLQAVRARGPTLDDHRPWERLTAEADLASLLRAAGLAIREVVSEPGREPLRRPDHWWTIVLGTGLRRFVDQLPPRDGAVVRAEAVRRARGVRAVETNVVYAVARRPMDPDSQPDQRRKTRP